MGNDLPACTSLQIYPLVWNHCHCTSLHVVRGAMFVSDVSLERCEVWGFHSKDSGWLLGCDLECGGSKVLQNFGILPRRPWLES